MLHEVSESKLQEVSEVGQLSDKLGQQNEIKGLPDKIIPESCDGEKKYSHCPIEGHNGSWEGNRGIPSGSRSKHIFLERQTRMTLQWAN